MILTMTWWRNGFECWWVRDKCLGTSNMEAHWITPERPENTYYDYLLIFSACSLLDVPPDALAHTQYQQQQQRHQNYCNVIPFYHSFQNGVHWEKNSLTARTWTFPLAHLCSTQAIYTRISTTKIILIENNIIDGDDGHIATFQLISKCTDTFTIYMILKMDG